MEELSDCWQRTQLLLPPHLPFAGRILWGISERHICPEGSKSGLTTNSQTAGALRAGSHQSESQIEQEMMSCLARASNATKGLLQTYTEVENTIL